MQNSWLYHNMHAKHHTKKVQRATEAFRLSVGDQVLDVGCSIAALNVVKAHPLSRSLYNAVIVYLIIELHSGAVLLLASLFFCLNLPVFNARRQLQNLFPTLSNLSSFQRSMHGTRRYIACTGGRDPVGSMYLPGRVIGPWWPMHLPG